MNKIFNNIMRGFHTYNTRRSAVLSKHAAVATSDPTATQVGIQLLQNGGNAADAAVGIAATLNLVDPGSTGIGGDVFVLFYDAKTKKVKGLNASGRSSSNMSLVYLKAKGISRAQGHIRIPLNSADSVNVPGAAAGWVDTVECFGSGKLSLKEILQPAITLCKEGYPVHEFSAYLQQKNEGVLQRTPHSFPDDMLLNGRAPQHGDVVKNTKLAGIFEKLAAEGKRGFYEGSIAQSIVDAVQGCGGCLTMQDMASHTNTFDEPISTDYKGIRIWEMPPNGQGLVALIAFNILKEMDQIPGDRLSAPYMHRLIEAVHLGFADGFRHIADSAKPDVLKRLLSDEHAKSKAELIQEEKIASEHYHYPTINSGQNTVYFSVVDSEGNACSFINSVYNYHGSGIVPKDCGFALQSRGGNFSLEEDHPNCVGPNKRSYHTIIPGMATHADTGELFACFGNMGAFMQPQGHVQLMTNLIDHQMDPQLAIDMPRFNIIYPDNPQTRPTVHIEDGVSQETMDELTRYGHNVKLTTGWDRIMFGRAQIILNKRDTYGNRVLWSGSESRTDGCAMGY
ncbi:glutathione hydrolase-like YwrD proenzyme [Clytia hemisphaerica]|eukprot:TCONS_00060672-protein